MTTPMWCGQIDVDADVGLPSRVRTPWGEPYRRGRLLVRRGGLPVAFIEVDLDDGRPDAGAIGAMARRVAAESPSPPSAPVDVDASLRVTVAVCTRDRPEELRVCVAALSRLEHPSLELLVVDNAPSDDGAQGVVAELGRRDARIRYVREPRPGLSRARNRALAEADGAVLAFTDDDVRVDPGWVGGLLRGFARAADIGCVTGLVVPATLDSAAEQYFDRRVWWSSDLKARVHRLRPGPGDGRLHPYTAGRFGTGANFAFRTALLGRLGGFDEGLGAGSPTGGGEDLDIFVRVLRDGSAIAYEPGALVWHLHRADEDQLRRQMRAYGTALSAYLTKYALSARTGPDLLCRAPLALAHATRLARRAEEATERAQLAPRSMLATEALGLLSGPLAYAKARRALDHEHVRRVRPR